MSEQPTLRALAQRIVTLSENVHSEQVSRLRAIHVLSETIIDFLDEADFACGCGGEPGTFHLATAHEGHPGAHPIRLIPDPLSCPEVPAETRDGETTDA